MEASEGIVMDFTNDGKARILIQGSDPCVSCESEAQGCHCSGGNSRMVINALNSVDASIGDLVSISHKPGALMKSIIVFLLIPAMGGILGIIAGAVLNQKFIVDQKGTIFTAGVGLLIGIIISILSYRRISDDIQPFIGRVIRTGLQVPSSVRFPDPVCGMDVDPALAAGRMAYNGKDYYFCHSGCLDAFMKAPERYVQGSSYKIAPLARP